VRSSVGSILSRQYNVHLPPTLGIMFLMGIAAVNIVQPVGSWGGGHKYNIWLRVPGTGRRAR